MKVLHSTKPVRRKPAVCDSHVHEVTIPMLKHRAPLSHSTNAVKAIILSNDTPPQY